jgi:hypothetical protein
LPRRSLIRNRLDTLYPPSETDAGKGREWSSAATRQDRYAILEGFADLTIYGGVYGDSIKRDFQAYRHVRAIASPFATVVDFHADHLLGPDVIDPDAGPGNPVPSSLPIVPGKTANEKAVRTAVAALWEASVWQSNKELLGWYGAALGDVGIEVLTDEERQKVRMRVVHPGEIHDVSLDPYGNCKYVALERDEADPADPQKIRTVKYKKTITNEGGTVTVREFRDGKPYQWPGSPAEEWDVPWGFVPFVLIRHQTRGKLWGVSELSKMLARGIELDSQLSALSDQVLKAIRVPWFVKGITQRVDPRTGKPEKIRIEVSEERDDIPFLTCNATDVTIDPLVYDLPIAPASDHAKRLELIISRDYPELLASDPVGLAASAEARREARRKAEAKIKARRTAYDSGIVRAHQMGMTMGGMLGFPAFAGFTVTSFNDGKTDHKIGSRSVFGEDPLEVLERKKLEADTFSTFFAGGQGLPIVTTLREIGWTQDKIDQFQEDLDAQLALEQQFNSDQPPDNTQTTDLAVVA